MTGSKRAYLSIMQSDDGRLFGGVTQAPMRVKGEVAPISIDRPGPLEDLAAIAAHGTAVRDGLMGHEEIKAVLDGLHAAPADETWSVLFGVSGPMGEAIRWEVVRGPDDAHVSLATCKRVFRVAADPSSRDLPTRYLPDPLRLAAILSPAGVDPTGEANAIVDALSAAATRGLAVEATVFTGTLSLLGGRRPANVVVRPMPGSPLELQAALGEARAHLVHFFCHGLADAPQCLQFATVTDVRRGLTSGSVPFSIDRLVESGALSDCWSVVFNCCDGGRPAEALNSMAFRAVAEGGAPMAVGMGAPLPVVAAPVFTRAFYMELFATLADAAVRAEAGVVAIDFGAAITEARRSLHEAVAASGAPQHCWSLPIIYLHRKELMAQKAPASVDVAAVAERVRTIAEMLRTLPASTPEAVRTDMLGLFDRPPIVPAALRCDVMGNFRGAR